MTSATKSYIITAMKDMKDMYKLCRFINSDAYQDNIFYDDERTEPYIEREDQEMANVCIQKYSRYTSKWYRKNLSKNDISKTFNNAMQKGYIRLFYNNNRKNLDVTNQGLRLISTKWIFRKAGLKEETLKEYPQTVELYKMKYGAIIAGISAILGALIGVIGTLLTL